MGDAPQASHSNTLLRQINDVLEQGGVSLGDVNLFAAATGPGSFTGLRIGLASIKGLAVTLNLPAIGVPTLQAVARAAGSSKLSVALLPAGRGELFAQSFSVLPDLTVLERDQPVHVSPQELRERYRGHHFIRWCGEGAQARHDEIRKWAHDDGIDFFELPVEAISPKQDGWMVASPQANLALHVAALAKAKFEQGDVGDPSSLRALYVRPSDAELKTNVNPVRS